MATRRLFLVGGAGAAAWAATPGWARRREPLVRGAVFGSGVAAGFPGQRSATLWTHVSELDRGGRLRLEVARDPGFARVVHREDVRARPARDFTARARVAEPRRLKPGTDYWYRFEGADTASPVGHFRTRRPPDSAEPIRLAFFSCQGWEGGFYTAHGGMAQEEDLDAIVSLGDYVYEETDDVGPRPDTTGANRDGNAQTLADYREKYRLYHSDPHLSASRAAHALLHVPDDHEIESGYSAGEPGETQGFERRVTFPERKRNALRAMFEHLPLERFPRPERDRVYRFLRLGRHAELFLTDLHRYADPYPCRGDVKAGPIAVEPCPERFAPGRGLLGDRQKARLKARLKASDATWKVWGSTLMMQGLMYGRDMPFNLGQWDGFAAERQEMMEFVLGEGIEDVAVVSGDIHTFFAGQVTTSGEADTPAGAVEFVGGAISSEGIPDTIADERYKDVLGTFTDNVTALNPHMSYAETKRRGYAVLTCGPDDLRVDFRAPVSVLVPESPVETLASFRVARGSKEIERTA